MTQEAVQLRNRWWRISDVGEISLGANTRQSQTSRQENYQCIRGNCESRGLLNLAFSVSLKHVLEGFKQKPGSPRFIVYGKFLPQGPILLLFRACFLYSLCFNSRNTQIYRGQNDWGAAHVPDRGKENKMVRSSLRLISFLPLILARSLCVLWISLLPPSSSLFPPEI